MTSAHVLYIPTIFLLGFLAGTLFRSRSNNLSEPTHIDDQSRKHSTVTGRVLFGSFLIFAFAFIGTHFFEVPRSSKAVTKAMNGLEIFDKKPSYSSDEVYARMENFTKEGRALYQQFTYTIDILFPITLFTFLFLLGRFASQRHSTSKYFQIALILLPSLWLASDFMENGIIFYLLEQYPATNHRLAGSLGYITITKFALLFLSILIPTLIIALKNVTGLSKQIIR